MSVPANSIVPSVISYSRRRHRPSVDLPQPDSPTRPSVSPSRTSKLTPSTAWTRATSRWKMIPCLIGKYFFTSRATSRGEPTATGCVRVAVLDDQVAHADSAIPGLMTASRWEARPSTGSRQASR